MVCLKAPTKSVLQIPPYDRENHSDRVLANDVDGGRDLEPKKHPGVSPRLVGSGSWTRHTQARSCPAQIDLRPDRRRMDWLRSVWLGLERVRKRGPWGYLDGLFLRQGD